jgi:hypothetical protein
VRCRLTEDFLDQRRRVRPVDLNHAVAHCVGVFFQFDVISDQEALEVDAHGGPKRAIHFEQQSIRGGPHVRFGNQMGALGQKQRRDEVAGYESLDVVAAHSVQE